MSAALRLQRNLLFYGCGIYANARSSETAFSVFFGVFLSRNGWWSDDDMLTIRGVRVNRNQDPKIALEATGREVKVYGDVDFATMPRGEGNIVDVTYVRTGHLAGCVEAADKLRRYGLVADPYGQAAVVLSDQDFAAFHPSICVWQSASSHWCSLVFQSRSQVEVLGRDRPWPNGLWLAGVRARK